MEILIPFLLALLTGVGSIWGFALQDEQAYMQECEQEGNTCSISMTAIPAIPSLAVFFGSMVVMEKYESRKKLKQQV